MYRQFFNFKTAPFTIAPDPYFIFMSTHHKEGLAHLLYGITEGGGFVALTGEVGTGKTMLCHCLLEQLPETVDIALVLNPKLNTIELLATLCDELSIAYDAQNQTLKTLIDRLNNYLLAAHAKGRRTVLLIDEAQNLSLDVLEQIRLLTNLETSKTKLLQIILVGQPELKKMLQLPELRQLNQRITARYHLVPLSYSETRLYIQHRLRTAGNHTSVFSKRAITKVYEISKGIPRLINILCDRGLLGAYARDSKVVSSKMIDKAAAEVLDNPCRSADYFLVHAIVVFLIISTLLLLVINWVPEKNQKKHIVLSGLFPQPVEPKLKLEQKTTNQQAVESVKPKLPELNFKTTVKQANLSLDKAVQQLTQRWGMSPAVNRCKEIERNGLKCLMDKSDWKHLIALNRPAIMEFSVADTEKKYALLVGIKKDQGIVYIKKQMAFPLHQILEDWDGYYLMLWQPPIKNISHVYPGQVSKAVLWIRAQLYRISIADQIRKPMLFDTQLKQRVIQFQQQKHIIPDGIVGPKTFIHLQNNSLQNSSPQLERLN